MTITATTKSRARKATVKAAPNAEIAWGYGVRTWSDAEGASHGGFKWDLTPGARTEAPDWRRTKSCGNGLHCNPNGLGDWSLLAKDYGAPGGAILGVVRYDASLAIDLDGKKIKAPWMEIVVTSRDASLGSVLGAIQTCILGEIMRRVKDAAGSLASKKNENAAATGYYGHAAATGNYGHAAATGNYGHAAATGNYGHAAAAGYYGHAAAAGYYGHAAAAGYYGHAAATGNYGHAAATGNYGHAAATGYYGHAAATGNYGVAVALGMGGRARASETGAIMLTAHKRERNGIYRLVAVFAGMVGQTYGDVTIKPGVWYALGVEGAPYEVTE